MKRMSLFDDREIYNPLANRLCPDDLDGLMGQEHLLGKGKLPRQFIEQDRTPSMIFQGPPGVGKTTLAGIIAKQTNAQFINFSAVTNGIKGAKEVVAQAENSQGIGIKTLLFVDEIHRFNRVQRDAFLPYVGKGSIILIGATTENPSLEINSALLSRHKVFVSRALAEGDLARLTKNALKSPKGLGYLNMEITNHMIEMIAGFVDKDARTALDTPEIAMTDGVISPNKTTVTEDMLEQCIGKKDLLYDKKGEECYNLVSAFHKSVRGSDPDTAVYWLARILEAGENLLYVARGLVRLTNEDIGMADSQALTLAVSAYQAYHFLGMSGCSIHPSHAVIYLSMTPKSNSTYMAYESAKANTQNMLVEPASLTIRNVPTGLMKDLHYDDDCVYTHDIKEEIARIQCLPDFLEGREYYCPTDQGAEEPVKGRLEKIRKWKRGRQSPLAAPSNHPISYSIN